jgi:hypothetical protein
VKGKSCDSFAPLGRSWCLRTRSILINVGDVVSTVTPAGVGLGLKPPRYLKPGDVVGIWNRRPWPGAPAGCRLCRSTTSGRMNSPLGKSAFLKMDVAGEAKRMFTVARRWRSASRLGEISGQASTLDLKLNLPSLIGMVRAASGATTSAIPSFAHRRLG